MKDLTMMKHIIKNKIVELLCTHTSFQFVNGHKVSTELFYSTPISKPHYDDGELYNFKNIRPCPKCTNMPDVNHDYDACLGKLPGVKFACCGHGQKEGYIIFENGVTIRGKFNIENPNNTNDNTNLK